MTPDGSPLLLDRAQASVSGLMGENTEGRRATAMISRMSAPEIQKITFTGVPPCIDPEVGRLLIDFDGVDCDQGRFLEGGNEVPRRAWCVI